MFNNIKIKPDTVSRPPAAWYVRNLWLYPQVSGLRELPGGMDGKDGTHRAIHTPSSTQRRSFPALRSALTPCMTSSRVKTRTRELLRMARLCKGEKSCGDRSAVLLYFRESIKFLVPLNKKTQLVKKQAFFLKCS